MIDPITRVTYFWEWSQSRRYVKNLVWFKRYSGSKMLKRWLKRQDIWLKDQNFGDYLSRIVISKTAQNLGFERRKKAIENKKIIAIGSILHYANDGDIIWGTGVNGKINPQKHSFTQLDVRMVRGPLTRQFLLKRNISTPKIFGDPALLLPKLFTHFVHKPISGKIIVVPNFNDLAMCAKIIPTGMKLVSPLLHWKSVLNEILTSELVIASSLHAIVLSESYGVPVRFVMPVGGEKLFKYKDYYLGTGREIDSEPDSIANVLTPDSGILMPKPTFDSKLMFDAFPGELFE